MLTALFAGHELPDFDAALEKQLGSYRVVLCYDDDECRHVEAVTLDAGLNEIKTITGYVKLFGKASGAS